MGLTMSIELRKKFETVLADYFKTRLFLGANIKVLRSSICIKKLTLLMLKESWLGDI